MGRFLFACALIGVSLAGICAAQELRAPDSVTAGGEATISTSGSGTATFYLLGPGGARKNEVVLGDEIRLQAEELRHAGAYLAIICLDICHSTTFTVTAAEPASLVFLVHPSRVPVGQPDAVSGVAFPFDRFDNLVWAPLSVKFEANSQKESLFAQAIPTKDGVAWFRTNSGKSAAGLQVVASVENLSARRVVQQVASEPCNLRIKGGRTSRGIEIETEPVRDCAGNPVSDGTIVTFTASGPDGKSTIDAPIKGGVARARVIAAQPVVISVASGVTMGNELHIGTRP